MSTSYSALTQYLKKVKQYPKRARALTLGDSWFQYPLRSYADLQRRIATGFKDDLLCLDDSYPGRDADESIRFLPRWTAVARTLREELNKPFDMILVSLGGNDVIGQDFARHLKPASEKSDFATYGWKWNGTVPDVARRHIRFKELNETFDMVRKAYQGLVDMRDAWAKKAPIVTHTYADVTPSNSKYEFFGFKSGPWLWKPMRKVDLLDPAEQRILSRWLLESFEDMLSKTFKKGVTVLSTRKELPTYEGWWDNEIHPLGKGFSHLYKKHWEPAIGKLLG